jgi:hypothetical protein
MKIWHLLRKCTFGSLISLLILTMAAMVVAQDRMGAAMVQDVPHMAMAEHPMDATDPMTQGLAHAACQIICLGASLAGPQEMPLMRARLLVLRLAPSLALAIVGRSPDPALRPPQPAPIA